MPTERAIVENKYPASGEYPHVGIDDGPARSRPLRLISKRREAGRIRLPVIDMQDPGHPLNDMDEMKTFAGGIAHNFNNLLMGINGYVELMLLDAPGRYLRSLEKIKDLIFSGSADIYRFLEVACGKKLPAALGRKLDEWENRRHEKAKTAESAARAESRRSGEGSPEKVTKLADRLVDELNTVLHDIQSIVALILANTGSGHPHYDPLKKMENLVAKGAQMTCQLLHCTRGSGLMVQTVQLDCLIMEAVETFCCVREGIDVHLSFPKTPIEIVADPCQLDQVLQNLYLNAGDAMPHGGSLAIEVSHVPASCDADPQCGKPPCAYVRISVRDTGEGMDSETVKHIFEPFFSTKSLKGRGLGLSSTYRTVQLHGGFIEVASRPGEGTTFHIYLPACAPPAADRWQGHAVSPAAVLGKSEAFNTPTTGIKL